MNTNYIDDFCKSKNLHISKHIQYNSRKHTSLLVVNFVNSDIKMILKIFEDSAPNSVQESFRNEIQFYNTFSNGFSPKLISSGKNFLFLEFFDAITLPAFIEQNFFNNVNSKSELNHLLFNLFSMFDWFHKDKSSNLNNNNSEQLISSKLFDRLGNLISSGPKGSSNSSFESFLLRQIFRLFSKKLHSKLKILAAEWISDGAKIFSQCAHNDLHCNNILIQKNYNIKLIDYEHFSSPGIWIIDTFYFVATLNALFFTKNNVQKRIHDEFFAYIIKQEPKLQTQKVKKLLNIFCLMAEVNSRFRIQGKGIRLQKIIKLVTSLIKF